MVFNTRLEDSANTTAAKEPGRRAALHTLRTGRTKKFARHTRLFTDQADDGHCRDRSRTTHASTMRISVLALDGETDYCIATRAPLTRTEMGQIPTCARR